MDFTIRKALAGDAEKISQCVKNAYAPYIERIGKPPGPMLDDYAEVIEKHIVFTIDTDNDLAAVLVLIENDGGILLDNVAVDPAYQGQRVGSCLLSLAESAAKKRGYSAIDLYTHEKMTENIPLYEKRGYVETERKNVNGYERIYMRKSLTA
ncbi:MAG: GNAT family N-acetyltransferase [Pseudomonadota bacterium]